MALATAIAAVGVGLGIAGLVGGYSASKENAAAQQQAIAAQQEAERLRKQQMDLDAMRRRREIIRSSVAARSASLATTTAQGAAYEGGSSLPGAYGSISGRTGVNTLGVNQNQEIGWGIFDAHQNQLTAYSRAAEAQSKQAMWGGLTQLGGTLISNAGTLGKMGTLAGGAVQTGWNFANWDGPTGFLTNRKGY